MEVFSAYSLFSETIDNKRALQEQLNVKLLKLLKQKVIKNED